MLLFFTFQSQFSESVENKQIKAISAFCLHNEHCLITALWDMVNMEHFARLQSKMQFKNTHLVYVEIHINDIRGKRLFPVPAWVAKANENDQQNFFP